VSPSQVTLSGTSSAQAAVTVTVARNATSGTLTLKGTWGSVTQSVTVSLTVNESGVSLTTFVSNSRFMYLD
jgi:hypothetical protein